MIKIEKDKEFIVNKSELIDDKEHGEKYVTITINSKILHFIFTGLSKYKEGFKGNSESDIEEREKTNKVIDEFNEVKDVLTGEYKKESITT